MNIVEKFRQINVRMILMHILNSYVKHFLDVHFWNFRIATFAMIHLTCFTQLDSYFNSVDCIGF